MGVAESHHMTEEGLLGKQTEQRTKSIGMAGHTNIQLFPGKKDLILPQFLLRSMTDL